MMKKSRIIAFVCTLVMMVSLFATTASAARVGDVIGYAQPTDIVATINGYQLESYNVDGYTYICVEDLRYYGFNVYYDNASRSLSVIRNWNVSNIDPQNTNPKFWDIGSNNSKKKILYTDIKTYVNNSYVGSCNINGQTIIRFDNLNVFGAVNYDDSRREISLVIEGMNYNPVAVYADALNETKEYNTDWKTIWRAKGDVLMLIGTSRSYMNSATKNDYVRNRFPEDKNDMIELHEICIDNGIPVSSVYIEARNSDGTVVASYQTR